MKSLLMKCCCLALIAVGLTNVSYASEFPKGNPDCYPITYFDTLEEAVTKYKELTASSSPVFMPTWLPFDPTSKSVRIVGCGSALKTEYVGDHQKIRVQVYPIYKNSKWEGSDAVSLSDDTKAEYKENKLFYALRFDKEERNYFILIDKMNVKQINKKTALEYLIKVADSLAMVEGMGNP